MYDDNTFRRFPRHDTDFFWKDLSGKWDEHKESSSWVHSALTVLWIVGLLALILYTCAHSTFCPCYNWLYKFRRQPRTEYGEDWARNQVIPGDEHHQALIPSAPHLDATRGANQRFEDPPPDYSQVVISDLPPYPGYCDPPPNDLHISVVIPDREWTSSTHMGHNI